MSKVLTKIHNYMQYYSKVSIISSYIENLSWFESNNDYILYLQREKFDINKLIIIINSDESY